MGQGLTHSNGLWCVIKHCAVDKCVTFSVAAYGAHPDDKEACGSIYPGRLSREVGCVHHKTGLGPFGGKTCVVTRESDSQRPPRTSLVFSSTGNEGPAVAAVSYFGSAANDRAVGRRHLDGSSLRLLSKIMALAVDVVGSDLHVCMSLFGVGGNNKCDAVLHV